MSKYLKKIKGDLYEIYVLDHILSNKLYEKAWLCKDTPDEVIINSGIKINEPKFNLVRDDFGVDIIAIKENKTYFIQCKKF